jgi:hypothetical protein
MPPIGAIPKPARALIQDIERLLTELEPHVHIEKTWAADTSHHDPASWAPHYRSSFDEPGRALRARLLEAWRELKTYLEPLLAARPEETRAAFEKVAWPVSSLITDDLYAWESGNLTGTFNRARKSLTRIVALVEGQPLPEL